MGVIPSLEFVPSDYKIKYVDSLVSNSFKIHKEQTTFIGLKSIRVIISKKIIETIKLPDAELTVGWLLGEVTKIYDALYDEGKLEEGTKKFVVGLKTYEGIPALDYYLTHLDNLLLPVKESTLLSVHFAKINDESPPSSSETINKNSFQYLKVIGSGGYSNVVLARKKDSGRLYAIKIIKKDGTYLKTSKSVYLTEANIMKKLTGLPFIVGLHYTFQTESELYFVMEPCIGGTLFHFMTH